MRLLLIGGIGFVGTNLLPLLLGEPKLELVTTLDGMRHTANPEILPKLAGDSRFRFIEGEICDRGLIEKLVEEHDTIVNLAAETFVDNSIKDSAEFVSTNLVGIHNLLESLKMRPAVRLIHTSTDEVWGEAVGAGRFTETSPYAPRNPYAATKAGADHLIRAYGQTYGISYSIIHFCNLFGPWQFPEKLIPLSITRLLEGRRIPIYGDGRQVRTWLHVDDANRGLISVLKGGRPGESYAFGTKSELMNRTVVDTLLKILGESPQKVEFVEDRPGHDFRYAVDYSKASRDLSWQPLVDFGEGIAATVEWFVSHPEWWRSRLNRVDAC